MFHLSWPKLRSSRKFAARYSGASPLARLLRVPEAFRAQVKSAIENFARDRGLSVVDSLIEDEAFAASRMAMCPVEPGKA